MRTKQEHLTDTEVADFRRLAISSAERRRLDAHVAACEDCLGRLLGPSHTHLALDSLTEAFMPSAAEKPFHLSREELKRYQTEGLDEADRIIFESHLEICPECNVEADSLQPAARAIPATESRSRFSYAFRHLPQFWTPARAVAVIAAVGCLLIVVALWIQRKPAQGPNQAAQTEHRDNPAVAPSVGESGGGNENESARAENNNQGAANIPAEEQGPAASENIVRLKDGDAEVSFDSQGHLTGLEKLAPQIQSSVQTALASGNLPEPRVLDELSGPKINLLGGPSAGLPFKLIAPVGVAVAHNRPTLSWQALEGAVSYTVSVFDSDFNRVATSGPQKAIRWTPPPGSLRSGKVYSWEVTATRDGQEVRSPVAPAPRAQFKIIEARQLNEIASVRTESPRSHLSLGVVYARAGLLDEAEREFRLLVKDNPRSRIARRFLHTVQGWRSR
ncbi:MAG TPA: hypothetical protein VJT09_19265 [Pyrinomonadaceae bacterium]|nr:hypothetical protein [Pyrinomonadaceae bacterium]